MIDLSDIVTDPDLADPAGFIINRTIGTFQRGGWAATPSTTEIPNPQLIPAFGVVVPATEREIEMVPEGDRVKGMMAFYTTTPIYTTSAAGNNISDQIAYAGDVYRIIKVGPWLAFGYNIAIGVRMGGD